MFIKELLYSNNKLRVTIKYNRRRYSDIIRITRLKYI